MFEIEFTAEAADDLRNMRKFDQRQIMDVIQEQLYHQPAIQTRNRKQLRPNALAEWELRIDRFRVFYDVDEDDQLVKIVSIGEKRGNVLFIRGEEFQL